MKTNIQTNLTKLCQIILIMVFGISILSCGPSEKEKLQSQVDSLNNELMANQEMNRTLNEISLLMDSIDASREVLRVNTIEGSSRKNYVGLMKNLNKYVRDAEKKIRRIESSLKKSKTFNSNLSATIKKLKSEVESRNNEIASLKETIEKYRVENENLIRISQEQSSTILDKQTQIETKNSEITTLTNQIDDVVNKARITEANGYYAQAEAVEETAHRTRLAPRKKRVTINESLTLYRKALLLGNTNAKAKITELEEELN